MLVKLLGAHMPIKMHCINSHLDDNSGDYSKEQGEIFIKIPQ